VQETAFDDGSMAVPSQDFDYDAVDKNLGFDTGDVSQVDIAAAISVLQKILEWIYQPGRKGIQNGDGIEVRAVIACWIFLTRLRPLSLTQIASMHGRDKQSLGRWVAKWKEKFPEIKTDHMKLE